MVRGRTSIVVALFTAAVLAGAGPVFAVGGWTVVSAPPAGANALLSGAGAVSDSAAWAVGSQGGAAGTGVGSRPLLDRWDGSTWTQVTAPATPGNTAALRAVSAGGPGDAWAVGNTAVNRSRFAPLALHWNGTAWTVAPSAATALPTGTILYGVADVGPDDAYAIGDNSSYASGELEHWNGTAWSAVTLPQPTDTGFPTTLNAISADGPDDVWIVGSYMVQAGPTNLRYETYSLHWNGTTWRVVPMPAATGSDTLFAYTLDAVAVNGPADVWAVGGSGDGVLGHGGTPTGTLTEHWDGTAWSIVPSPSSGTETGLTGVAVSDRAGVWAVGYRLPAGATSPQPLSLHWNGTVWTTVATPGPDGSGSLSSVSATPGSGVVWAVGRSGASGSFAPLVLRNG